MSLSWASDNISSTFSSTVSLSASIIGLPYSFSCTIIEIYLPIPRCENSKREKKNESLNTAIDQNQRSFLWQTRKFRGKKIEVSREEWSKLRNLIVIEAISAPREYIFSYGSHIVQTVNFVHLAIDERPNISTVYNARKFELKSAKRSAKIDTNQSGQAVRGKPEREKRSVGFHVNFVASLDCFKAS